MRKYLLLCLLFMTLIPAVTGQPIRQEDSAEILVQLKKLNFLGSVLYVAAHPDDENTRLISYLENDRYARTAYLSLTRGDGGQNLVGPEIREALGIIRTQELLAARRIDGGDQFFSRANDFGYSKNAEETLRIWDREKVLADVVWTYRKFRPDIIITRFPPDERAGHGHHTSSAIMAREAFKIAGNPETFPEQLQFTKPWQPERLFTNTGRWWNPNMTADEPGVVAVDVGTYNPLLGESMTEIAARSRSQHKSQGFGATGSRGQEEEFLEYVMGSRVENNIFEGIDTSWNRVEGGAAIGRELDKIIASYSAMDPAASLPAMVSLRKKISGLEDEFWRSLKLDETDRIIRAMTGLYLEARAGTWRLYPGQEVNVSLEAINRSDYPVTLQKIVLDGRELSPGKLLKENVLWEDTVRLSVPATTDISQPYWLKQSGSLGMYSVEKQTNIGKPENDPALIASVYLKFGDQDLEVEIPVEYKWNDPVQGELRRPLVIGPPVTASVSAPVYLFSAGKSKEITVQVTSHISNEELTVKPVAGPGWAVDPPSQAIRVSNPGETVTLTFEITPPASQSVDELVIQSELQGKVYTLSETVINYDHFPAQTIFPKATARLVNVPIKKYGDRVGYIQGAGDAIPETLRELGYDVWEMAESEVTPDNLEGLDAVILGVRALNTNEGIATYMDDLLEYSRKGGTLIVQYNTSYRLLSEEFAPFPLQLSRQRVADENAPVTILATDHPVVQEPNLILPEDFEGWVQERGLYFPGEWDNAYIPVLSSHDPGEEPLNGGLLIARYGEGYYIYTGYSWFRELPAGVPGAIKLFTNLVSLGNDNPTSKLSGE